MALVRGGITVKAHVQAFANACQAATGADSYGTYNGHSPPEGPTQALDIFNPDNAGGYALQDRIVNFAMANQKRFGIRYIIRRRQIWNVERAGEGWRNQSVTGNRTADHYDHVHITFYATAAAVEPEPTPVPVPEEEVTMFIFDAPPERGGGVWQSDGVFRKPVRTGDTWPNVEGDTKKGRPAVAKHLGVASVGLFDDLIDIEAQLASLKPSPVVDVDVAGLDPQAVADLVVKRLGGGLAKEVADLLAQRLAS